MSVQQRRDAAYGRRGGGWSDSDGSGATGPPCEVCGRPMVARQKHRHGVCSPLMECCGAYSDLVADKAAHAKAHREMANVR